MTRLLLSLGNIPSHAPEIHFEGEERPDKDEADDPFDEDEDFFTESEDDFPDFHFN